MNIIKLAKKAVAFTLAETLVVMGIIGVVAALTIPNLNQSTGNRETVTKLKKVYANLEDAFGRATAVYGPVEEWFNSFDEEDDDYDKAINKRFADRITEFMKISKDCGFDGEGCFTTEYYKTLDNDENEGPYAWDNEPMVLLADGTALDFYIHSKSCSSDLGATSDSPLSQSCGIIYVDLDGVKGSNTEGKDSFFFRVTKTGIYPTGGQNSKAGENTEALKSNCFTNGNDCAGWVIETGNMDYLKATEGTCPNGTELSWENTSCK